MPRSDTRHSGFRQPLNVLSVGDGLTYADARELRRKTCAVRQPT